jgi:protein-L-isoaspartate(D-aspartate) O-methyltransferase
MDFSIARRRMVEQQIRGRGIHDPLVLEAMLQVPRHLFVEEALRGQAYSDFPLPIGEKQTISQPFMVGFMTAALQLRGGEKVLEIGTGSGYQAAVLARIADKVYTVERIVPLARKARKILDSLGANNVNIKVSDGTVGWEEAAPFDAIMVTAGGPAIPETYLGQLSPGGRLVIPVGDRGTQVLKRVTLKGAGERVEENLLDCRFVPLVGQYGWQDAG